MLPSDKFRHPKLGRSAHARRFCFWPSQPPLKSVQTISEGAQKCGQRLRPSRAWSQESALQARRLESKAQRPPLPCDQHRPVSNLLGLWFRKLRSASAPRGRDVVGCPYYPACGAIPDSCRCLRARPRHRERCENRAAALAESAIKCMRGIFANRFIKFSSHIRCHCWTRKSILGAVPRRLAISGRFARQRLLWRRA